MTQDGRLYSEKGYDKARSFTTTINLQKKHKCDGYTERGKRVTK